MKYTREQIEQDAQTINLKKELYEARNSALDYLVTHDELEGAIEGHLQIAEYLLSEWSDRFMEYLVTDDDYYSSVAHRILGPVYATLDFLAGVDAELEEERDQLLERVKELEERG